jgi:hypothetical protein
LECGVFFDSGGGGEVWFDGLDGMEEGILAVVADGDEVTFSFTAGVLESEVVEGLSWITAGLAGSFAPELDEGLEPG